MTPQERAAMQLAFNALIPNGTTYGKAALEALRAALEAPEPSVDYSSLAAMAAEVERLKKDAARLNWFEQQGCEDGLSWVHDGKRWLIEGPYSTLRKALDECMVASIVTQEMKPS